MLFKVLGFFVLCLVALAGNAFACGADTSPKKYKSLSIVGNEVSALQKLNPESKSDGFGLTDSTTVKDDRWEKVKNRLKKTQEALEQRGH